MIKEIEDEKIKDCYEFIKPHIGHTHTRVGRVLTSSGTIEPFPENENRQEFFQNNMAV